MRGEKPLWLPTGYDFVNISPSCIPDNVARAFIMELTPFPIEGQRARFLRVEWEHVPKAGGSMVRAGKPRCRTSAAGRYITFPDLKDRLGAKRKAELGSYRRRARRMHDDPQRSFRAFDIVHGFSEAAVALIDDEQKTRSTGCSRGSVTSTKRRSRFSRSITTSTSFASTTTGAASGHRSSLRIQCERCFCPT